MVLCTPPSVGGVSLPGVRIRCDARVVACCRLMLRLRIDVRVLIMLCDGAPCMWGCTPLCAPWVRLGGARAWSADGDTRVDSAGVYTNQNMSAIGPFLYMTLLLCQSKLVPEWQ